MGGAGDRTSVELSKAVSFFVTGTDTGVGKSVVTGALAAALRQRGIDCGIMKPVQTGALPSDGERYAPDAEYLRQVSGISDPIELICPQMFDEPVAPSVAAEAEGRAVDIPAIHAAFAALAARHEMLLVEGAGGLAVPLRDTYVMADLAHEMDLPLIIVARPALGTINHTVLTVEYARLKGLRIAGIVISGYPATPTLAERSAPAEIERLTGVPILGLLPQLDGVDTDRLQPGDSVEAMVKSGIVERMLIFEPCE